jgi:Ca2+-binding RTX toxin-like protein
MSFQATVPATFYLAVSGNDTLNGSIFGSSPDTLAGEAGNDYFIGNNFGADLIEGGDGDDTVDYTTVERVNINLQTGQASKNTPLPEPEPVQPDPLLPIPVIQPPLIIGSDTPVIGISPALPFPTPPDTLVGAPLSPATDTLSSIENAIGSLGDDEIIGNNLSNDLMGQAGDDTLDGGFGNDTIAGGLDDDLLNGGLGDDKLGGGAGADRFVIANIQGMDTVSDFEVGIDSLMLDGLILEQLELTQRDNDVRIEFIENRSSAGCSSKRHR